MNKTQRSHPPQRSRVKRSSEIEFGYDHVNSLNETLTTTTTKIATRVVYPGNEDSSSVHYSDGDFVNHQSSVTLVVKNSAHNNNHTISLLCWILVLVLLLSIIVVIVIVVCVCVRARKTRNNNTKQKHRIATHINAFSPSLNSTTATTNPSLRHPSIEMLPKYVPSPAQSYSKLYQWCQQRELQQQYKSLWAVNPTNNDDTEQISCAPAEVNENPNAYKTRSLPSKNKQRPVSSIEDLDELYSRVNFSKKLRNRMTNNEAKIIAFCRSRSQNLSQYSSNSGGGGGGGGCSSGPKEEAFVVYDERTAL